MPLSVRHGDGLRLRELREARPAQRVVRRRSGPCRCKTDRCLGRVNYHDGHIRSKRVAIGYIIDPARQRKGLAVEAVSAMLNFCFGELGLHRVQAFIHSDNTASRKLVEKLGFRREGLLRDNLRVGDVWRDDVLFAVLETDRRSQMI
jgi:RimJ/RimL family protein N-acetyltransferase